MGVIFNYLWICNINSILLPDPIELTFSNTLLLSIAATCLCIYSLTTSIFMLNIYLYYYFFLCKFMSINYYIFIFQILFLQVHFILLLLHFSHVIVGIVLLGFVFTSLYNVKLFYL